MSLVPDQVTALIANAKRVLPKPSITATEIEMLARPIEDILLTLNSFSIEADKNFRKVVPRIVRVARRRLIDGIELWESDARAHQFMSIGAKERTDLTTSILNTRAFYELLIDLEISITSRSLFEDSGINTHSLLKLIQQAVFATNNTLERLRLVEVLAFKYSAFRVFTANPGNTDSLFNGNVPSIFTGTGDKVRLYDRITDEYIWVKRLQSMPIEEGPGYLDYRRPLHNLKPRPRFLLF